MYEVPGKDEFLPQLNIVAKIDKDYQLIGSHVDKTLKEKVTNFEYVDFK